MHLKTKGLIKKADYILYANFERGISNKMPGLDQLKQFSEDVAKIGNELTIREERGEPIVQVPFPTDISAEDDSDDFILGMPLQREDGEDDVEVVDAIDDTSSSSAASDGSEQVDYSAFPELDSLLNPEPADNMDFSDFPELDALLNPPSPEASSAAADLDNSLAEIPTLEEAGLGSSLDGFDFPDFDSEGSGETTAAAPAEDSLGDGLTDFDNLGPDISVDSDDPNTMELDFDGQLSEDQPDSRGFDSADSLQESGADDSMSPASFDLPDFDATDTTDSAGAGGSFGDDSLGGGDFGGGLSDFDLPDFDNLGPDIAVDSDDANTVELDNNGQLYGDQPESVDSDFADTMDTDVAADAGATGSAADFALPDFDSVDDGDVSEEDHRAAIDFGGDGPAKIDTDFATMTVSDDEYASAETGGDSDDSDKDPFAPEYHEVFDAPDDPFEGMEPPPDENFDDFVIPGISDQAAGVAMAKPKRISLAGKDGKKEKHTLTDKEYETFLKNLKNYPLNLRIELQKFIVSDEFKDEAVFEIIQKVLKKTSARQLATHLEKLLDISIPVPREFERRTAAQYEEYKKSAEYQLKNRILPIAIIAVMAACIMFFVFLFGKNFIYEPLRANSLYQEGYALLEEGAYPQSEMKFDEASTYQQQKRWFFKYAEGYRQHKQYERARMIYKAGLQRFKQDKELGLAYAEMELYDLRNFENAEKVVRREVLDYHINDPDGMLLLGDIFLEWGDERDPAKYEDARQVYDDLLQIYGQQDVYLARMMRYYIRVDNLRNVLQMKGYFYPKKKALGGQDLIELSGYLLDKISGNIAPADEYLLSSIEDVRKLLERAVEAAPDVPESLYNMGLYFMNANNSANARNWLSAALTSFENAQYKPRKRLLRQLNTYRLLGDLDVEKGEYITAEEKYRTGVSLFEKAAEAGLVGDSNIGQLYASLGDINLMHTGDYDEALRNYSLAAQTQYDVPSVSYKMGYINYSNKQYGEALNLFIKTAEKKPSDTHVLLALGNALSARGDNFAAQGYYQRLMDHLDRQMVRYEILLPHDNDDHAAFIRMYKRASNNLGVTLYRLARQTGNSTMNADALTNFTASIRAFDSLYRNPETLVRQEGSNLAERNIKYMSMPVPDFEPSIYTEIEPLLEGEVIR